MDKFITILIFGSAYVASSCIQCKSSWIQPTCIESNANSHCIPEGFDLVINCTRNPEWCPTEASANISLRKQPVNSTTSQTLQEWTDVGQGIQVSIPTVSENDSAVYQCCYQDDCAGLRFIVVKPPLRPKKFECVIYNIDYMECTWISVQKWVSWSIEFETIPGPTLRYKEPVLNQTGCNQNGDPVPLDNDPQCTCVIDNDTTCVRNVWRLDIPRLDVTYNFNLTGKGLYGTSSHYFNITSNYAIEKLGNLSGCRHSFNGTRVAVCCLFPFPPEGFTNGIKCNITAQSRYSSQFDTIRCTEEKEKQFCYHLEKSHPYTSYTVTLMCQVSQSRYWGTPHVYQFKTPEDVPLVGPSTSKQSYTAWCRAEQLHILIYIKPPNEYQTQGVLTGYHMQINSSVDYWNVTFNGNKATLSISEYYTTCGVSVKYDVIIWSQTKRGDSKEGTPMSIRANLTSMSITEVIVEETNSGYLVSWKGKTGQSSNCTYHWCLTDPHSQDNKYNATCLGRYNFTESTDKQLLIPLKKDSGSNWQFGVSQKDTGIRWQDCVFENGPPLKKPDRLVVTVESNIKLYPLSFCSRKSRLGPRPSSYFVSYANIETNTDNNITFPADSTTAFSSKQLGLRAEKNYSVKYKILYSDGLQSDYSDEVFIDTPAKVADTTTDVWRILGAIIGGIVFLVILLILVYKAQKKWKNFDDKIENVAIPDPNFNEHCHTEVIGEMLTNSPESGLGTLSSTATNQTPNAELSATHPLLNMPWNIYEESHDNLANNAKEESTEEEPAQCPSVGDGDISSNSRNNTINMISTTQVGFSRKQNTDYIQVCNIVPKCPSAVARSNYTESCLSSRNFSGKSDSEYDSYQILSRNMSGPTNSDSAYSQITTENEISTSESSFNVSLINDRNVIVQSGSGTPNHSVNYQNAIVQRGWNTQSHDIVCDVFSQNTTDKNCSDTTITECGMDVQTSTQNNSTKISLDPTTCDIAYMQPQGEGYKKEQNCHSTQQSACGDYVSSLFIESQLLENSCS
ncbi:uncharacterized protein LOC117322327 [Pecten maximus]|uniref:uncharacterized protein LOC117322327 n=1 Tax=Pecten maximus TaxID=6579 RepID=UPI001458E0FC|nr:uncharacterized protein LOC117322327 [Pecten maximus]